MSDQALWFKPTKVSLPPALQEVELDRVSVLQLLVPISLLIAQNAIRQVAVSMVSVQFRETSIRYKHPLQLHPKRGHSMC